MGKLDRREKRNKEREERKIKNRRYSYAEVTEMVNKACVDMERQYDVLYSTGLAVSLSAEPTSFGPKRVCRTVGLFFDQIHSIKEGVVSEKQLLEAAEKLGVTAKYVDDRLEVFVRDYNEEG